MANESANGTTRRRRPRAKSAKPKVVPPGNEGAPESPGEITDDKLELYFEQIGDAARAQGAASTKVASMYQEFGKAGGHSAAMRKVLSLSKMDEEKRRAELRALWRYVKLFGLDDFDQSDIEDAHGVDGPVAGATPAQLSVAAG